MTRRAILTALVLAVGAGAAPPTEARDTPYLVRVDLGADIRALGSDDLFVSEPAADHLVALGDVALPALTAALRREPPPTRVGVIAVLQQIPGEAAARLLIEAAGDRDAAVRADALLALGLRKTPAGAAVVEAHLGDPDPRARRSAALSCNALCNSPAALERLAGLAVHDREATSAQQSLHTIVVFGESARAAAARAAIEHQALPVLAADDADPTVRVNAGITAAIAGRREAIPVLVAATQDGSPASLRPLAVLALGGVTDPDAVVALTRLTQSKDPSLRNAACVGLQQLSARGVAGAGQAASACPTPVPKP